MKCERCQGRGEVTVHDYPRLVRCPKCMSDKQKVGAALLKLYAAKATLTEDTPAYIAVDDAVQLLETVEAAAEIVVLHDPSQPPLS
jgi:hypothetical protein